MRGVFPRALCSLALKTPKDSNRTAPAWLPTLCGIAGLVGGEEPVVCYSLVRHKEDSHDMA